MRLNRSLKKILSVIATLATIFNSLGAPVTVIAQEITPEPTPTPIEEPTSTPEATIAPTETPTESPTPTETATATPIATVEPTPVVEETTPAPETTQPETQNTTSENTQSLAPPSESPTVSPSSTPEVLSEHGDLTVTTIENVDLSQVTLLNSEVDGNSNITTDKADYAPTDIVLITGTGFTPHKDYTINIVSSDDPPVDFKDQIKADESGNISYAYQLDGKYRPNYAIFVKNGEVVIASTTFTDSSVGTYDQCSNDDGDGYATGDLGCRWINGNLQGNNSIYYEGDATVQRLWIAGFVPGSNHTVTLKYGTTKGGKHAYDYLTKWNHSEDWISEVDRCQDITDCVGTTETSFVIPDDLNVSNTIEPQGSPLRDMVIRGGIISAISTPTIVSGSYAGDSETVITVSFTVDATDDIGDMCKVTGNGPNTTTTCDIALWFGAHVSNQSDWGVGSSAVSISGSPYHVALTAVDNADQTQGGGRDNQMQADTIVQTGSITIIKDAQPNDSQNFSFTTTGGLSNFSLDDDSDPTLLNTTSYTGVSAGPYTITEGAVAGWTLQSAVCLDNSNQQTVASGNGATINLAAGQNVTCTFINTKDTGKLELQKDFVGTPENVTIKIGTTQGGSEVDTDLLTGDGTDGEHTLNTGSYYVSESLTNPSYYTSALACFNDVDNDNTVSQGDTSHTVDTNTGAVSIGNGDDVICVYTNTRNGGTIELVKVWSGTGGQTTLNIGTSAGGSQVANTQTGTNGSGPLTTGTKNVDTGTYYVSETGGLTDYSSQLACTDNGQNVTPGASNSLSVDSGHAVICTYTNTRNQGTIELKKVWSGTGGQTTLNIGTSAGDDGVDTQLTGADGAGPLTTGQNNVDTGTYYLSETGGLSNYTSSALTCFNDANNNGTNDDTSPVTVGANDSVSVTTGKHVICSYTNTRNTGRIQLAKDFVGTTESVTIKIGEVQGGSEVESKGLTADGLSSEHTVDTGTYFVSETLTNPNNYTTTLACYNDTDDSDTYSQGDTIHTVDTGTGEVVVDSGDDIFCVYTNTRNQGTIELVKVWSGTGGQTTLNIGTSAGGSQVISTQTGADGGTPLTTGAQTVDTGTFYVSESGGLDDYSSQLACTDDGQSTNIGSNDSVIVPNGHAVVCTFTNTRDQGTIELKKVWSGTGGQTTLNIGTTAGDNDVDTEQTGFAGAGPLTTGQNTVDTGVFYLSETGGLSDYTTSALSCFNDADNNGSNSGEDSVTVGANDSVSVEDGQHVICTFTNTRNTGSVKVNKLLDGDGNGSFETTNPGTFTWTLDEVGPKVMGTTATGVDTGSYDVDENTVTDYHLVGWYPGGTGSTQYSCTNLPEGEQYLDLPATVSVTTGNTTEITICNARDTGTITVNKVLIPENDEGLFNLQIDGQTAGTGSDVGDGGTTGVITVITGTHSVGETAGESTSLSDYTSTIVCSDESNISGTLLEDLTVDEGDNLICTITNTRIIRKISIVKDNDKSSGASAGDEVTYTLKITNEGNTDFDSVLVTDILPGGFTYISGSTLGATFINVIGSKISWSIDTGLKASEEATITYRAKIESSVSNGTYVNFATCQGLYGERSAEPCNQDDSSVPIGSNPSFGGNLTGQVLGISTELPATGSPTGLALIALGLIGAGFILKKKYVKN